MKMNSRFVSFAVRAAAAMTIIITLASTFAISAFAASSVMAPSGSACGKSASVGTSAGSTGSQDAVLTILDGIMNGSIVYDDSTVMTVGSVFNGSRSGERSMGYAKNVFVLCFGVTPGSAQSTCFNYFLSPTAGIIRTGSATGIGNTSAKRDGINALFSDVHAGDFVQMRAVGGEAHSAIVYSVSASGVTFLEADADGRNTVELNTYTWSDLCTGFTAMSIYTAGNC